MQKIGHGKPCPYALETERFTKGMSELHGSSNGVYQRLRNFQAVGRIIAASVILTMAPGMNG